MVSVRCQTESQLIDVQTIPIIKPGELQSVMCDWQIPLDVRVVRFTAVVDRGLEIQEGDEDNNAMEELVAIGEFVNENADSTESGLSAQTTMIAVILLALGAIGFIIFMMPPKIKKIQ